MCYLRLISAQPYSTEMTPAYFTIHLITPIEQVVYSDRVITTCKIKTIKITLRVPQRRYFWKGFVNDLREGRITF